MYFLAPKMRMWDKFYVYEHHVWTVGLCTGLYYVGKHIKQFQDGVLPHLFWIFLADFEKIWEEMPLAEE